MVMAMDRRGVLLGVTSLTAGLVAGANAAEAQPATSSRKFKIMVTGGHPGDPEYGCGGTIARLTALGHEVVLLYLNNGAWPPTPAETRIAEAARACAILRSRPAYAGQTNGHAVLDNDQYEAFHKIIDAEKPDAIFSQWPIDNHRDHRAISMLTYDAWTRSGKKFALYYYEVSDGEDTLQFSPNQFVDITDVEPLKRSACFAHASQTPDRYYKLQDMVAQFRGIQSGCEKAEAFVRQIQNPYDIFQMTNISVR